ncbi:MCE family protein [Pedobacter changchengzhani]|uniref:MCE family protein n=1 Tax=Pedobacter changchengzhani TaxID=2529274 RepID=A0A4R5ML94_9SPHI|nr:MlaD family protein [Pedobacter changchengzhani]TDG36464.1 MCE family protein [Pedobacter changchengzhani]
MADQKKNNIKLGIFVVSGLALLIFAFFIIGKNQNLFGSDFKLKVRFSNIGGLTQGNNVLFSGIQAGTVKDIDIINDTTIEVTMRINSKVKAFIHKNATATVGTEGLMGNKVINILPVKGKSALVEEGDLLYAQQSASMEEIIQTLSKTNENVQSISEVLKGTVLKIDSSAILKLINDEQIGISLKASLENIYVATKNANQMTAGLNNLVADIRNGKGAAGMLLTDTAVAKELQYAVSKIKLASINANQMTVEANDLVKSLNNELKNGTGPVHTLLRDSTMSRDLKRSMSNIQKGSDGFNQIMESLKHSFLFRGYFKRQDREKKQEPKKEETLTEQKAKELEQ